MAKSVKRIIVEDPIEVPEPFEFETNDEFEGYYQAVDADGNYHFRGADGKLYLLAQSDTIDKALEHIEKDSSVLLSIVCKAPGKFRISVDE